MQRQDGVKGFEGSPGRRLERITPNKPWKVGSKSNEP
jgi:hypothetical protein